MCSCSASAAVSRRSACGGGMPARSTASSAQTDGGEAHAADGLEGDRHQAPRAASACGSRRRAAAATAIRPSAIRSASPRRAARLCRARAARRDYEVVAARDDGRRRRDRDRARRAPHERARRRSSASMSAARSPTCSFSTRRRGRSAPPRCRRTRGDEAQGFLERPAARSAALAAHRTRSCTARRSAPTRCSSARARKTGVITTRGFRDVLEMRRRDRPQHLGPVGRVRAGGDRDLRRRGARAHAGRRHHPHGGRSRRGAARRAKRCSPRGAEAVAIIFINAYANAENERTRARGGSRRSGRTTTSTASHEILPEIREFERTSTTALNAYLQPVVGGYLGKLDAALWRAELRRASC